MNGILKMACNFLKNILKGARTLACMSREGFGQQVKKSIEFFFKLFFPVLSLHFLEKKNKKKTNVCIKNEF